MTGMVSTQRRATNVRGFGLSSPCGRFTGSAGAALAAVLLALSSPSTAAPEGPGDAPGAKQAAADPLARAKSHWAFHPPARPPLPEPRDRAWARTPIDRFILAKLDEAGMAPSPEADRTTLCRRLHLDLVGLPPTVEDADLFTSDATPPAYETLVEKLLASPHHGERWARHWLDAARYADTEGFEKDKERFIWNYRDWVVNAINRDLPYDQFVIEQLAGDLLPSPTQDQLVATGFLRNSMLNEEGGVDPEQFRMDAMFDRMECIGKGILGLTIQCAQCHTHKFDPLTHEEYYRLFAFLNSDHETSIVAYTPAEEMVRAEVLRQMREIEDGLRHTTPGWEERMARWEESARAGETEWHVLELKHEGENDVRYYPRKDGSLISCGYAPTKHTTRWAAATQLQGVTAFRLELFTDPELPRGGPGRSILGTCALTEFRVEAADASNPSSGADVKVVRATADFGNEVRPLEPIFDDLSGEKRVTGPVSLAIDGKDETAWGIDAGPGRRNQDRKAVFVLEKPIGFASGTRLKVKLQQDHGGWNSDANQNNLLGRFRISVTTAPEPSADPLPRRLREVLATPREARSRGDAAALFSHWRTTVPEWKEANDRIEALWRKWPEGSTTLTLMARDEPRQTTILKRGDWLKPSSAVTPGVPAFLHALPEVREPARLAFARWLVDPRSPTTARVIVNRIWQHYFGTGLVDTPEDFGLQSTKPSHPELLDWLACELMEPTWAPGKGNSAVRTSGRDDTGAAPWSLKHIHRLIVMSAVYRQSSRVTPRLQETDPFNRLLARGPRFRVEGEIVRDIALASSGLLNPKLGGPSIFSPAPEFLFKPPASYGPFEWPEETGPDRYRRAIYTFRRRSTPYPPLTNFDAPNADSSCVRRARSNTPLQALTTLNEPVFMECARALALRTLEHGGATDAQRIAYAFRRVLSRPPTSAETAELLGLLERQIQHIAEGWVNQLELATGKNEVPEAIPGGATPAVLAAYTIVSRVLLNLDEAITKE